MTVYEIVDATREHVLDLRDRLRPLDVRECAGYGASARSVLYRTFRRSFYARTALSDGRVIAMWGLGGALVGDEGNPWFLTAREVERFPIAVVREARYGVAEMLTVRKFLWNYVLADYAQAVKLVGMLGFTVDEPQRVGVDIYRRFWMRG